MRVRELSRCVCDGRHRRGVLLRAAPVGNGAGPGTKIQSFTTPLPHASLSQRYRRAVPRARLKPWLSTGSAPTSTELPASDRCAQSVCRPPAACRWNVLWSLGQT